MSCRWLEHIRVGTRVPPFASTSTVFAVVVSPPFCAQLVRVRVTAHARVGSMTISNSSSVWLRRVHSTVVSAHAPYDAVATLPGRVRGRWGVPPRCGCRVARCNLIEGKVPPRGHLGQGLRFVVGLPVCCGKRSLQGLSQGTMIAEC